MARPVILVGDCIDHGSVVELGAVAPLAVLAVAQACARERQVLVLGMADAQERFAATRPSSFAPAVRSDTGPDATAA